MQATHIPFSPKDSDSLARHIAMLRDECRLDLGFEAIHEVFSPESECLCIMAPNVVDTLHDKGSLGFDTDVVEELSYGRQVSAWEDVMVYETGALSESTIHTTSPRDLLLGLGICFVSPLRHRNALENCDSVFFQQSIYASKVRA